MPPNTSGATSDAIAAPFWAGLNAGTAAGVAGFIVGGTYGVWRSPMPVLQAIGTSIQFSLCGGFYWGIRSAVMDSGVVREPSPYNAILVSAGSGAASFGISGLILRGRRGIIPGSVMGTVLATSGQLCYNLIDSSRAPADVSKSKDPFWVRFLKSGWSPLKLISKEDHARMLEEKVLKLEVEISLVDDELQKLQLDALQGSSNGTDDGTT